MLPTKKVLLRVPFMHVDTTNYEKTVLYGIVKFPYANDRQIAEKFDIKQSTVAAIRKRLKKEGYYNLFIVPMIQNFGAESMMVTDTVFNPVVPFKKRVEITKKYIEPAEEIVFSLGEEDKGLSISFSENFTNIAKINDIRTKIFGELGLLDKSYPNIIIFPFETSKIYRFFDFAPLLGTLFEIEDRETPDNFFAKKELQLSPRERRVLCKIIELPEVPSIQIADMLNITRHTVGRLKKKFMEDGHLKTIVIPDFKKLNLKILAYYHISLNPHNAPNFEKEELREIMCNEMIFFATRPFEFIAISLHNDYDTYKKCQNFVIQKLKEKDWATFIPYVKTYSLQKATIIKDFTFLPITKKITQ